jgi:fluoride exporter
VIGQRGREVSNLLAIGAGGFAGALARYAIDRGAIYQTGVPIAWPTFLVNVSGSFFIGVLFVLITERAVLPAWLRGPLMIGLVGSYTTFSTVALAGWRMIEDGAWLNAAANLGGSVLLGLVAVIAGVIIGRML